MYVHVLMCSRLKRNYSDLYIVDVIDCLSVCQTLTSRSNDYQGVKKTTTTAYFVSYRYVRKLH